MNKFFSANKRKIVWIVIGIIAILLAVVAVDVYQYIPRSILPMPPSAILHVQGMEQKAEIIGYCWDDGCGDFLYFGTPGKALRVNSPLVATLGFSIDTLPNEVSIGVYDASRLREVSPTWSLRYWDFNSFNKDSLVLEKELAPKKERTFSLELKSGLYVISVSADWAEHGSVDYGFLVEVR